MTPDQRAPNPQRDDFLRAAQQRSPGFAREMFNFLRTGGRGWLAPIILALLLIAVFVMLGGTSMAPFIYALF